MSTRTILVADDFDDFRAIIKSWLETRGYRVVEAVDGEAALAVAKRERPDLILMDIGMPQRSGISAIYRIRKDPLLCNTPIVVLTAYDTEELRRDAMDAGASDYLIKVTDTGPIEETIERLLPTHQAWDEGTQ